MSTITTHASAPSWAAVHRTLIVFLAAIAAALLVVTITVLSSPDTASSVPLDAPAVQESLAPPGGSGLSECGGPSKPARAC